MPERERVTRRPNGEPTFHIFYELVAGATGELRRYLQLDGVPSASEPCAFMTPLQTVRPVVLFVQCLSFVILSCLLIFCFWFFATLATAGGR